MLKNLNKESSLSLLGISETGNGGMSRDFSANFLFGTQSTHFGQFFLSFT